MKRLLKILLNLTHFFLELLIFFLLILSIYLGYVIQFKYPEIKDTSSLKLERQIIGDNQYRIENNWALKNDEGIWEVYVEGDAFERGVVYGKLLEEQVQLQEDHFINQIKEIVPSDFYRFFLKVLIGYFNRDLYDFIPEEYRKEIYGVSHSFSDQHDHEAPKFYRILNYHAAHDIGHALADYMLVGCTSFSVKNQFSQDSSLLVGRNFDFYVGDEFAEEKVLSFINPSEGYKFASYSWAGLMGVVSGMNEEGLCLTINAAKSDLPTKTKTPITIVTREILQYAKTIDEAIEIAQKSEVFVSETIMVTSASDNKTVLIEISPNKLDVYDLDSAKVLCTNHYQSNAYSNDENNIYNIEHSDSKYRYERLTELITEKEPLNTAETAAILRNQKGVGGDNLGMGNPKALNQLIAHHSVIFKPQERKMWISTPPFQLGKYLCYDLDEVFDKAGSRNLEKNLYIDSLNIAEDPFLDKPAFKDFQFYHNIKKKLSKNFMLGLEYELSKKNREKFIASNPESYITYMTLGQYYLYKEEYKKAKHYFELSLTKEVASKDEVAKIEDLIDECN